jgi:hypothetical protein
MGNAQAQGLEHLLPANGGDFDLIVLGLQESTYDVKEKGLKKGLSTVDKTLVTAAEAVYRDAEGDTGVSGESSAPQQKMNSNKSFMNSVRNVFSDTDDQSTRAASRERCVEILLDNIETILGFSFYLVLEMLYPIVILHCLFILFSLFLIRWSMLNEFKCSSLSLATRE